VFSLRNGSSVNPSRCAEERSIRLSSSFPVLALKNGISVNPVLALKNGSPVTPSQCTEERLPRLSTLLVPALPCLHPLAHSRAEIHNRFFQS
jgi:hypothetical protein